MLQLTESAVMDEAGIAVSTLRELRSLGCAVAMDDFGSGYSSLGLLRQLLIDTLRIDWAFLNNLSPTPAAHAHVQAIVTLGNALKLKVVAEGVETEEQRARLVDLHCFVGQGYHFAKPMPAEQLGRFMHEGRAAVAEVPH